MLQYIVLCINLLTLQFLHFSTLCCAPTCLHCRSGPLLIKIPVPAHQAKAWGKQAQQDAAPAEAEALESLRRDSEQTEMNFELKPAMSLTRVDSDTLLVRLAPRIPR